MSIKVKALAIHTASHAHTRGRKGKEMYLGSRRLKPFRISCPNPECATDKEHFGKHVLAEHLCGSNAGPQACVHPESTAYWLQVLLSSLASFTRIPAATCQSWHSIPQSSTMSPHFKSFSTMWSDRHQGLSNTHIPSFHFHRWNFSVVSVDFGRNSNFLFYQARLAWSDPF